MIIIKQTASALSHKIITNTTMCFSNLVGPLEEIEFYGHPMDYIAPSSYGQPHVSILSSSQLFRIVCNIFL